MKRVGGWIVVGVAALLCLAATSWGAADWQSLRSFPLEGEALDVAISPDGLWIYVLTRDGKVLVYNQAGILKNRLDIGEGASAIAAGPEEGSLYVARSSSQQISVLAVALQYDFDLERSPAKGPPDAPVAIVVFSDFQ
jgi:hypothetical protein